MNTVSIIQTQQLIAAIGTAVIKIRSAASDKKFSLLEIFDFIKDWDIYKQGIVGIDRIPEELFDLSEQEEMQIMDQIAEYLKGFNVAYRHADYTRDVVSIAIRILKLAKDILKPVPIPEIVP